MGDGGMTAMKFLRSRPFRLSSLGCCGALAALGLNAFTLVPDIDRSSHQSVPNYNNARLNDASVTPSAFVPRSDIVVQLKKAFPGVAYAVVLERHHSLFVGVDNTPQPGERMPGVRQMKAWLGKHERGENRIYVSTDATLVDHFHRYAADRAHHLQVGSDIVMNDIERVFPGAG